MAAHDDGRTTLEFLLERGRLEHVETHRPGMSSLPLLDRARRRLQTANAARELGDLEGAFSLAYDAYRISGEALLLCQGLRATGGEGAHVTVEDAVSAQFARLIPPFAKPIFERFRRMRHAVQYFDPSASEIDIDDVNWALTAARNAVDQVAGFLAMDPPPPFRRGSEGS